MPMASKLGRARLATESSSAVCAGTIDGQARTETATAIARLARRARIVTRLTTVLSFPRSQARSTAFLPEFHSTPGFVPKSILLIHEAQQSCRDATYEPSRFPVAVPYPSPHRATPAYVVVTSSDLDTSRNKASVRGLSWISRKSINRASVLYMNSDAAQGKLRQYFRSDRAESLPEEAACSTGIANGLAAHRRQEVNGISWRSGVSRPCGASTPGRSSMKAPTWPGT